MAYTLALITLFTIVILVILGIRITIRTLRYMKWRKASIPAIGITGELKNVTSTYDKNGEVSLFCYNYALKIVIDTQEFDDVYSEECRPGDTPTTRPGNKINILWSPSDHKYVQIATTGKEIWRLVKQECAFIVHIALLILGNRRYFRDHHRKHHR